MRRIFIVTTLVLAALPLAAEVPSPSAFLGYEIGERFTPHHRIIDYFRALDAASDSLTLVAHGETYEGRPLVHALITSPENMARIEEIRAGIASIADPATDAERARSLARASPAVVWLAFGVHGNESSSAEAAMMTAWKLLQDEPAMATLRSELVTVIDPLQNPDGRERYLAFYRQSTGQRPNADPQSLEHDEQWPGGRFNHYLTDMNRDWAWTTQRESAARVKAFLSWPPQVFVDFHEMGHDSSYFFPPAAAPISMNISARTARWLDVFGEANAEAFSNESWPFFVGERFDLFYPGYGDSWPALHGTVGMTYEMAGHGRAGSLVERPDGTTLSLAERAERHHTAALATLRTAATHRTQLLVEQHAALREAWESSDVTYLLDGKAMHLADAVELLRHQGINVVRLREPATLKVTDYRTGKTESRTFEAGTAVVPTRQRWAGLVHALMERNPRMSDEFLEQQRRNVENEIPDEFYDITAWSIPLSHDIPAWTTTATVKGTEPWASRRALPPGEGAYGYIVDADQPGTYRFIGRLLRERIRFSVASVPIKFEGRSYARGTLVILRHNNDDNLSDRVRAAASGLPLEIIPVDRGWTGGRGTALGSDSIRHVIDPAIAIVTGEGLSPTSVGSIWHLFDVTLDFPHTLLRSSSLGSIDLRNYRTIIVPDGGSFAQRLGERGTERLAQWVDAGGTLIVIGRSAAFTRDEETELSELTTWNERQKEESEETSTRDLSISIPGSAFAATMNDRSHITFGLSRAPVVLLSGNDALVAHPQTKANIVTIRSDSPLLAGVAWKESLEKVSGSPFVVRETHGDGEVVTFADDPVFRGFWIGTMPLLMNAAIYGPTF